MRCILLLHVTLPALCLSLTEAINGGTPRVSTSNGWKAIEIITEGDNPSDNIFYSMPGTFDGAGAYLVDDCTLRIQVNHEQKDASISEVDLDLTSLQSAIANTIASGTTGGVVFVRNAQKAYDRWSIDGGSTWTTTTNFKWLCSAHAYPPKTFGKDRGFVDQIYITGEEDGSKRHARLFALDSVNRDLYQLSGMIGSAPGGNGGMPSDAWENAALLDTDETAHIALLLSADGGTQRLRIYIGEKGKDQTGMPSTGFLARNGLAFGSWYYLKGSLPNTRNGHNKQGTFDTSPKGALAADKCEDISTNPNNPKQVVLGNQNYGVFVFDFSLDFAGGAFDATSSSFTIRQISKSKGEMNSLNNPDNVEWTRSTASYPDGLIFVNEDSSDGEIWQMNPDGSNKTKVGQTNAGEESTGIFDLSEFVGYEPASILITNNQGSTSSMTLLIHPGATLAKRKRRRRCKQSRRKYVRQRSTN